MLNMIIFALPAIGWGLMPVIAQKTEGKAEEQLLGTTISALVVGLIIHGLASITYSKTIILAAFLSGLFWAFGQLFQFIALKNEDVSRIMPISNGTQLLFTTLSSGILLREWQAPLEVVISLIALIIVMIAIYLFSKQPKKTEKSLKNPISIRTYTYLIASSICLTIYVSITSFFNVSGNGIFLPQSIGMFVMAAIIYVLNREKKDIKKFPQIL